MCIHPSFQKPARMGNAQSSPYTHLIPPSAFLRVETPHWTPSLSLLRKKRVSSSRDQQNQRRHKQWPYRPLSCSLPSLSSKHVSQQRLGWFQHAKSCIGRTNPVLPYKRAAQSSAWAPWEGRDLGGARAATRPAYIPQVNSRCALGKEA